MECKSNVPLRLSPCTNLSRSDLDFEYPANAAEGQGLPDLFTELRTAFDNLANSKGDKTPYQLSAAVAAGPNNYANLVVPQMNAALTYWNLMSYDYSGDWLDYSDNQANLYGGCPHRCQHRRCCADISFQLARMPGRSTWVFLFMDASLKIPMGWEHHTVVCVSKTIF